MIFTWFKSKSFILLLAFSLLLPFQNCAVYESDERKEFNSLLSEADGGGCYPYIDTNIAMTYLNAVSGLGVFKTKLTAEAGYSCDFVPTAVNVMSFVSCEVSRSSALNLVNLKTNGVNAFPGTLAVWTAVSGQINGSFSGSHGGYVGNNPDGKYSVKYLALRTGGFKGVECTFKVLPATWTANNATIQIALSKMATEMAFNNPE